MRISPFLPRLFLLRATLHGASQILLQRHAGCGLLVLVALGLQAPALLAGALLGLLGGTLMAVARGYAAAEIEAGVYGYNAALLGLLLVLVVGDTPLAWLLAALAGTLCAPLQRQLLHRLHRQGQPALTLVFVLLGWLALGLIGLLDGVLDARLPETAPTDWDALDGIWRGVGHMVFLSAPGAAACLFAGLLWANRSAALWALCGSAAGIYLALLVDADAPHALAGLAGYNPALAALALSQASRSALAPAAGILVAIVARLGFDQLVLTPLTMPFILACWTVTLALQGRRPRPGWEPA